jgi:hypothetical protein
MPGIVLDGTGAPGFEDQLDNRIARTRKAALRASSAASARLVDMANNMAQAREFFVRVSNQGGRAVLRYIIRIEMTGKDGKPIASTTDRSFSLKQPFAPGSSEIDSLGGEDSSYLRILRASPGLRVSLDAVEFDDGQVVGPDVGDFFSVLKANEKLVHSLLADIDSIGIANKAAISARLDEARRDSHSTLDRMTVISLRPGLMDTTTAAGYLNRLDDLRTMPAVWRVQ